MWFGRLITGTQVDFNIPVYFLWTPHVSRAEETLSFREDVRMFDLRRTTVNWTKEGSVVIRNVRNEVVKYQS